MSPAASKRPQGPGPYRWLLAAYPRGYRTEHGTHILATLAETTGPSRRIPPLREIAGLLRGGLATRPHYTAQGLVPWWADGIHLGVFLLALLDFAPIAANVFDATIQVAQHPGFHYSPWWYPWSALLPLMVAVALMRGWVWVALPPAAAMVFEASRDLPGGHLFRAIPYYGPAQQTGAAMLPYWLILAGLISLAARHPRNLRHRSWCWWLPVLLGMYAAEEYAQTPGNPQWQITQTALTVGLLLVALWATAVSGDFRWTLATTIVTITGELSTLRNLPTTLYYGLPATLHSGNSLVVGTLIYSGATAILLTAMVLAALRRRRERRSDPSH